METRRRLLDVVRPGRVDYAAGLAMQAEAVRRRRAGEIADRLILLEHPPVITRGTGSHDDHILLGADELATRGIELADAGRGGDVTFHGPGQLVGYPILDLKPNRQDLHRYLRDLEQVIIDAVGHLGIEAGRVDGLTGVWADEGKIAAIGVRVSSGWITSHGFALNIGIDLAGFDVIVPCGIADRSVSSLERELGRSLDPRVVEQAVIRSFVGVFGHEPPTALESPTSFQGTVGGANS